MIDNSDRAKAFEKGTIYYIFPGVITDFSTYSVPKEWHFDIYKATRGRTLMRGNEFKVLTSSGKETVESGPSFSSFNYRQPMYIFDDKMSALAFRQKYFSILYKLFEENDVNYLAKIKKTMNLDFERVLKKAPHLYL